MRLPPSLLTLMLSLAVAPLLAQSHAVLEDSGGTRISRHLYGHFSEHLGAGIYGGLWVGEASAIPNTRGLRKDVVGALKRIRVPNLRWPGGCFADTYHWKDGIGPRELRPSIVNTNWGGTTEDNAFGTHEFMDLCAQLGCEPVVCGNVGSGTVREMAEWVEYLNSPGPGPMANLRRANGHPEPWKVTYFGIGNEAWGCGGNMTPEHYADLFRQYQTFLPTYGNQRLVKIASGANEGNTDWTEAVMKGAGDYLDAISLHYYVVFWQDRGQAATFTDKDWYKTLRGALRMEDMISRHTAVMDRYDPGKRVGLIVDEWGDWFDVEPRTNPGFLYQQNTLRDALVAGITLNIFNQHADRLRMANLAQMVNVLQSVILTDGPKMLLTPTYHVLDLYKVHQDATLLPLTLKSETLDQVPGRPPALSASASRDRQGLIHISLCNLDLTAARELTIELKNLKASAVTGQILTAAAMNAHNTFDQPEAIRPATFSGMSLGDGGLAIKLPPKSVVMLELR